MYNKFLRYNIQFFAENEGENAGESSGESTGENGANGSEAGSSSPSGEKPKPAQNNGAKTFTQAEVDKIVKERLKRAQRAISGDEGQQAEGAQAQPDAAAQAAQAQLAVANQRLVQAAGMTEAVKLGVDPKYTTQVIKLADFSKIEVGEDGTVDTNAVAKAIEAVLKEVPMFKTTVETAGGFKVGGEGQQQPKNNGWNNNQQANSQNVKPWNRVNRF